jgi:hypothetical protein
MRLARPLALPDALYEIELARSAEALAATNRTTVRAISFMGAGCWDHFIPAAVLMAIVDEAKTNPELVASAPHTMPVGRLDEVKAVKEPRLTWRSWRLIISGVPK